MTDDLMMDKNCRGEVPSPMGWGTQPLQGGNARLRNIVTEKENGKRKMEK